MELAVKLLEERYDNGNSDKPMSDDLLGLYQHMKNVRRYIDTRTDEIEKERFEYKATRSLRAARMSAYLEYEQASELTSEMLDILVDRILVLSDGVQVIYKIETTTSLLT